MEKKELEDKLDNEERAQAQAGVSSYLSAAVGATLNIVGYNTDKNTINALELMIKKLDERIIGWQQNADTYELSKKTSRGRGGTVNDRARQL